LSTDWYTRLVLTVVAVCLALLVAQGYREGAGAPGSEDGRYRLNVVPMARTVLRFDSETGTTWKTIFPELKIWTKVAESPAELLEGAIDAPAEAPREAPATEAPEVVDPETGELGIPASP
jgi:hypothetical protein